MKTRTTKAGKQTEGWAKVRRFDNNHANGRFHAWQGNLAACGKGQTDKPTRVKRKDRPTNACLDCVAVMDGVRSGGRRLNPCSVCDKVGLHLVECPGFKGQAKGSDPIVFVPMQVVAA